MHFVHLILASSSVDWEQRCCCRKEKKSMGSKTHLPAAKAGHTVRISAPWSKPELLPAVMHERQEV